MPYSYYARFSTQGSSETTSNGLLTTIERAAHSDDESAPPSLNPSAATDAMDADDLPNYENVSTSPMMTSASSSTKIPTPSRFADSSRINTSQFAIKTQRSSGTSTPVPPPPPVTASAEPVVRRPSSGLGSRSGNFGFILPWNSLIFHWSKLLTTSSCSSKSWSLRGL